MNHVRTFQKRKENFVCEHCNRKVEGDGYTNHCPHCLYSKHVDIFPGDRLNDCGGLMKIIDTQKKGERYVLIYQCEKCGKQSKDHLRESDNIDALITLTSSGED